MTTTTERTAHTERVGTIEDLGVLEELPQRTTAGVAGRGKEYNPFDAKIVETYQTGKPRVAVADNLDSARVLIRRAAAYAGLGVDIVPTVTPDGRDAIAYLARPKRARKADAVPTTTAQAPAVDDMQSFDEDPGEEDEGA